MVTSPSTRRKPFWQAVGTLPVKAAVTQSARLPNRIYLRLPEIQQRTDSSQDALLVKVSTDAGVTGWGEVDGRPPGGQGGDRCRPPGKTWPIVGIFAGIGHHRARSRREQRLGYRAPAEIGQYLRAARLQSGRFEEDGALSIRDVATNHQSAMHGPRPRDG